MGNGTIKLFKTPLWLIGDRADFGPGPENYFLKYLAIKLIYYRD